MSYLAMKQWAMLRNVFGYQMLREIGEVIPRECNVDPEFAKLSRIGAVYAIIMDLYNHCHKYIHTYFSNIVTKTIFTWDIY